MIEMDQSTVVIWSYECLKLHES